LQPGDYFVGDDDYRIRTLLGSCVSITLWHATRRIGAMSHFLLPGRGENLSNEIDGRYGDEVLVLMLHELAQLGIAANELQAKIFGGSDMFSKQFSANGTSIGRKNGDAARAQLQNHGISIVSESLFGVGHRQVIFDIDSGHVWSRQIPPIEVS